MWTVCCVKTTQARRSDFRILDLRRLRLPSWPHIGHGQRFHLRVNAAPGFSGTFKKSSGPYESASARTFGPPLAIAQLFHLWPSRPRVRNGSGDGRLVSLFGSPCICISTEGDASTAKGRPHFGSTIVDHKSLRALQSRATRSRPSQPFIIHR